MAFETLIADGIAHMGVGAGFSILDFAGSKLASSKAKRIDKKKKCLESMEFILDAEKSGSGNDSSEYSGHVETVRNYLAASGKAGLKLSLTDKIKGGFRYFVSHEKINNLGNLRKLWVAVGIEILFDIVFDFGSRGVSGVAASLYQIPVFWIGLVVGGAFCGFLDVLVSSEDEHKLDQTIRSLADETKIADIVTGYEAPEESADVGDHADAGQKVLDGAQKIAETARDAADRISTYAERKEEKHEQEREKRKKRFDELTKGR